MAGCGTRYSDEGGAMTYAEKLKDHRWIAFRNDYIERRRGRELELEIRCDDCGQEDPPIVHVHHRLYDDREPWDYDDSELFLLCKDCHEQVHAFEKRIRRFVIAIHPSVLDEFAGFLDALEECQNPHLMKLCLARAKNTIRHISQGGDEFDKMLKGAGIEFPPHGR
jgi:hypothetical protein